MFIDNQKATTSTVVVSLVPGYFSRKAALFLRFCFFSLAFYFSIFALRFFFAALH